MSFWTLLVAHTDNALIVATLVFMFVRGRTRECWSFTVYLASVLVNGSLMLYWPRDFYTPEFYVIAQGFYDVLKLLIAVEIAHRAFRRFPGARPLVRTVLLLLLALSTLAFLAIPRYVPHQTWFEWQPRIVTATVWLFTATAFLILWYRVPVRRWHRDILLGFTAYLLIFVTLLGILRERGWNLLPVIGTLDTLAYLLLLCWWARSAARAAEQPGMAPALARQLGIEAA